jgi:hypothetical protein
MNGKLLNLLAVDQSLEELQNVIRPDFFAVAPRHPRCA